MVQSISAVHRLPKSRVHATSTMRCASNALACTVHFIIWRTVHEILNYIVQLQTVNCTFITATTPLNVLWLHCALQCAFAGHFTLVEIAIFLCSSCVLDLPKSSHSFHEDSVILLLRHIIMRSEASNIGTPLYIWSLEACVVHF